MASLPLPTQSSSEDNIEWITDYLTTHSLSIPSQRYSFLLWLGVLAVFLVFALLHWTGFRGDLIGAIWSKWAIRRRTLRKKHSVATNQAHRQPTPLPSNAQLLSLTMLTLASLAFAFVGPDYIDPNLKVWQFRRSAESQSFAAVNYMPYMPQSTISKSLWTSSARVGQIAFALLPLCVLFALKAPPFAIFAIPFMTQLYFDKLAWLHRWIGRLIWLLTFIHVILWSIKLATDVNSNTGRVAYIYAWDYHPFIFGWIAFTLLTLIILLSIHPIRRRFYEYFYIAHLLLVPVMLIFAWLHHPAVAFWCWAALAVWVGERFWRGTWWLYANRILGRVASSSSPAPSDSKRETWEMGHVHNVSAESGLQHLPMDGRTPSPLHAYYFHDKSPASPESTSQARLSASFPRSVDYNPFRASLYVSSTPYIPPTGYMHAELVSGRTVRLRLITPGFLPWSPGQHFLLNIPSISRFTSHPFTCASVCDEEAPTNAGRVMLFLIRAKGRWTQDLWHLVSQLTEERSRGDIPLSFPSDRLPKNGVLLRAHVDGPYGSAKRARWGNYSTAVIIAGGSGVSFGASLLQYMCMCISGRDGRHLGGKPGGWGYKGAELKRVRFIWLVHEYSHLQWCASIIRHCMSIVPSSALQVDIYVTNFKPLPLQHPIALTLPSAPDYREPVKYDEELQPPHPTFMRDYSRRDSIDSHDSQESDVDLSYYLGEYHDNEPPADEMQTAHEENMLDLTNFDGDVEVALPGEASLSHKLRHEGKLRRLRSRKRSAAEKGNPDAQSSQPLANSEARAPRPTQDSRQATTTPSRLSPEPRPRRNQRLSMQSADRLLALSPLASSPLSEKGQVSESPLHAYSPLNLAPSASDSAPTDSSAAPHGDPRSFGRPARDSHDATSEPEKSLAFQVPPLTTLKSGDSDTELTFEMDEQEAHDINVVSEHARPGKPKLDRLIAEEVQVAKGALVVACCGPTSLNAMVRKIVAAQIDPRRICKGDMRGSITMVSEEFEY